MDTSIMLRYVPHAFIGTSFEKLGKQPSGRLQKEAEKTRHSSCVCHTAAVVSGSLVLIQGGLVPHKAPVRNGRRRVSSAFRKGTQTQPQRGREGVRTSHSKA